MKPTLSAAALAAICAFPLAGCMEAGASVSGADFPGVSGDLAPAVPKDDRSHGDYQRMTGINGDAVAAVSGDAKQSYVYFDPVAANRAAVPLAPAKLCQSYGKKLKSSRLTEPVDRATEPGIKVLAVQCAG